MAGHVPQDLLDKPFEPCAIYFSEGDFTEIILRDVPVINRQIAPGVSAGYDMETGELVLLRVSGDISKQ